MSSTTSMTLSCMSWVLLEAMQVSGNFEHSFLMIQKEFRVAKNYIGKIQVKAIYLIGQLSGTLTSCVIDKGLRVQISVLTL